MAYWAPALGGGAMAGMVEGTYQLGMQLRGGPGSAGIVIFLPVLFVIYVGGGMLLGMLVGAAIGLLPAWAVASLTPAIAPRWGRTGATFAWFAVCGIPAVVLLVAPEQLEPLLLSRGLISELPTHAHGDEAKPKGPVQVQTSHVTAAEVPVDITGTGVLRSLGPKEEGWELSVPIAGPYVDQVHPRGELSIHWNGPGWYTNHISAVRPAGDGGKEAVAILPNNNDARADDHPEVRIPVGKHAGWLAPDHSVFSGPGDLHLLEVTPASPPMAGRGRIRKHALRVTNLEGKIQIEPISGVLVDGMIVVVGGEDLPEGAEVVLAPAP